jgi:hypothetical protein
MSFLLFKISMFPLWSFLHLPGSLSPKSSNKERMPPGGTKFGHPWIEKAQTEIMKSATLHFKKVRQSSTTDELIKRFFKVTVSCGRCRRRRRLEWNLYHCS